jgi:hypothetical protein
VKKPARSLLSIDVRTLLAEHVAEVELVASLEAAPVIDPAIASLDDRAIETITAEQSARRARLSDEATRAALLILARESKGESPRPPFRGVLAALRALDEARVDGAPLRSTSSPSRFEPEHRGASGTASGDVAQRAVERIAPISRLWALCLCDGWTLTTYPALAQLDAQQAREVVIWATLGIPGTRVPLQHPQPMRGEGARQKQPKYRLAVRGKPRVSDDVDPYDDPSPRDVAEHASAAFGVEVPVGHVVALRREGIAELYSRLAGRGLIPRDGRLDAMAATRATPWDVEGWKEIASTLGCSERTAQRVASRTDRPAPTYRTFVGVVAVRAELAEWMRGEMKR